MTSRGSSTNTTRSRRISPRFRGNKREAPIASALPRLPARAANEVASGNLTTKSLTPIVDPSILVQDSEYLETHLIVVPANLKKDFLKEYEELAPMVVPRSAVQVAQDDEFVLFTATTFKKHSPEFLQKCREHKYTPRQYKYVEGGKEEEQKEFARVEREEKKVWGEALRLGRTGWSESVMIWAHVLTLRVFVETVLRYGLPLEFVSALVAVRRHGRAPLSSRLFSLLTDNHALRRRQSSPRRSSRSWTEHFRTSVGTLLAGTSEAELLRTMPRYHPKWRLQAWAPEKAMNTWPTCTTRSKYRARPRNGGTDEGGRRHRRMQDSPQGRSFLVPKQTLTRAARYAASGIFSLVIPYSAGSMGCLATWSSIS